MTRCRHLAHLARRFFGSLRPGSPAPADEAWAEAQLLPDEVGLWRRLSNPDRRHAVGVARAVAASLGPSAGRPVLAAALLHDVGKIVSGYRTPARVAATVVWAAVGDDRADAWLERPPPWRRLAQYRRHPELGAELLRAAGADPLTVAWAAEHHLPPARWSVPVDVATVLAACDDD